MQSSFSDSFRVDQPDTTDIAWGMNALSRNSRQRERPCEVASNGDDIHREAGQGGM